MVEEACLVLGACLFAPRALPSTLPPTDSCCVCGPRHPLQTYLLERLAAGDLATGKLLLHATVRRLLLTARP